MSARRLLGKQDTDLPPKVRARAELYYLSYARTYRNDGVAESVENSRVAGARQECAVAVEGDKRSGGKCLAHAAATSWPLSRPAAAHAGPANIFVGTAVRGVPPTRNSLGRLVGGRPQKAVPADAALQKLQPRVQITRVHAAARGVPDSVNQQLLTPGIIGRGAVALSTSLPYRASRERPCGREIHRSRNERGWREPRSPVWAWNDWVPWQA